MYIMSSLAISRVNNCKKSILGYERTMNEEDYEVVNDY